MRLGLCVGPVMENSEVSESGGGMLEGFRPMLDGRLLYCTNYPHS